MISIKDVIISEWAFRICRWFYAFIFLYAGLNKFQDPQSFSVVIEAFGLVPGVLVPSIAILLPVLEILAAVGLIFNIRGSLMLVTGLLVLFLLIVSYGLWIGLDIDCGCFGPGDPEGEAFASLRPTFYRNISLILGTVYFHVRNFGRFQDWLFKTNLFTMITKINRRRMSNDYQ